MSLLAMHWAAAQQQTSPDGNVVLSFLLKADGTLTYKMTYKGKPVINESTLGFTLKKNEPLTNHFKIVSDSKSMSVAPTPLRANLNTSLNVPRR